MYRPSCCSRAHRPAAATVEFAVLAPLLAFLFLLAVDYGRVFYYSVIVQNAARKGALYGCQDAAHSIDKVGIRDAALADATDITPPQAVGAGVVSSLKQGGPGVVSTTGADANGNPTVSVTVAYSLQTVANYPGIPNRVDLVRTVSMRVLP